MKNEHTMRVDELNDLIESMTERRNALRTKVSQAVTADSAAHLVINLSATAVDLEIAKLLHNVITTDLASYLEMERVLDLTVEAFTAIRDEEKQKATGEKSEL